MILNLNQTLPHCLTDSVNCWLAWLPVLVVSLFTEQNSFQWLSSIILSIFLLLFQHCGSQLDHWEQKGVRNSGTTPRDLQGVIPEVKPTQPFYLLCPQRSLVWQLSVRSHFGFHAKPLVGHIKLSLECAKQEDTAPTWKQFGETPLTKKQKAWQNTEAFLPAFEITIAEKWMHCIQCDTLQLWDT